MSRRHLVNILSDSTNDDTQDASYDTTFLLKVPAEVVDARGQESYRGKQLQAETTHVIEMRYYPGITTQMIAQNVETGELYYINNILDKTGRQRFLLLETISTGETTPVT